MNIEEKPYNLTECKDFTLYLTKNEDKKKTSQILKWVNMCVFKYSMYSYLKFVDRNKLQKIETE